MKKALFTTLVICLSLSSLTFTTSISANPPSGGISLNISGATNNDPNTNPNTSSDPQDYPYAPSVLFDWAAASDLDPDTYVDRIDMYLDGGYWATWCGIPGPTTCTNSGSGAYNLYVPNIPSGQHTTTVQMDVWGVQSRNLDGTPNFGPINTITSSPINFWMATTPPTPPPTCTLSISRQTNDGLESGGYYESGAYSYDIFGLPTNSPLQIQNSDYTYDVPCDRTLSIIGLNSVGFLYPSNTPSFYVASGWGQAQTLTTSFSGGNTPGKAIFNTKAVLDVLTPRASP